MEMGTQPVDKARVLSRERERAGAFRPRSSVCSLSQVLPFQDTGFVKFAFLCVCGAHTRGTSATLCTVRKHHEQGNLQKSPQWPGRCGCRSENWETTSSSLSESRDSKQEVGREYEPRVHLPGTFFLQQGSASQSFRHCQNNTANLGPSVQISKPTGGISHSNHHRGQGGTSGVFPPPVTFSLIASRQKLSVWGGCLVRASGVLPGSAVQCRGCRYMQPWLCAAETQSLYAARTDLGLTV